MEITEVWTSLIPYVNSKLKTPRLTGVKKVRIHWLGIRVVIQTFDDGTDKTDVKEIRSLLDDTATEEPIQ